MSAMLAAKRRRLFLRLSSISAMPADAHYEERIFCAQSDIYLAMRKRLCSPCRDAAHGAIC